MSRPAASPPVGAITADIFLGLSAVLLVVLALVSVGLRDAVLDGVARASEADAIRLGADAAALSADGRTIIYADGFGVTVLRGGVVQARIPTDAIGTDPALGAALAEAGADTLAVISSEGQEAAFLLDPALARLGASRVARVRLDPRCGGFVAAPGGVVCNAR